MKLIRLAIAELRFRYDRILAFVNKHLSLPRLALPSTTEDRYARFTIEKDVPISMRDGVRLYADIYRPEAPGPFPVILIRLPYGKAEFYCQMPAYGRFWAKKGYVFVAQDVRGKWRSEGIFEPLINEGVDGYDTLDWIAEQPWCDGNIGMMGESYFGYTQWAAAVLNHPHLRCIAPMNIGADRFYRNYQDGALCLQTFAGWSAGQDTHTVRNAYRLDPWHLPLISMASDAGLPSKYYEDVIRHPRRDSFWDAHCLHDRYDCVRIPALHVGGWYDLFLKGTIDGWRGVKEGSQSSDARENQWLLIAPIDHERTPGSTNRIGRLRLEGGDWHKAWMFDRHQQFFDYWLKGLDNGWGDRPRVETFVIGENRWRFEGEWPLARAVPTNYYLHSQGAANTLHGDGTLQAVEPQQEPADRYVYDPDRPIAISFDTDLWRLASDLKDRRKVEDRQDVLVYTTESLEEDIEVTGPIHVNLFAASSARDTDFTATLVDVFPDGYGHLIQEGIIRARYRDSDSDPSLIEPDKVYLYKIDLWATSYRIKKGHRIRLEISSSNFNRFDRNPNTGNPFGLDDQIASATQTIYHDQEFPSHITLPIIPRR